ncbi:peptidase inhibitor family I36 protein [Nonomuraea sp. NPDC003804]|uniref:peptidase inhibitor family I36 protein n=1 Tax=Nonomuraea sp. NPDC003804 TaxID=3154547 RepID=UPI0033A3A71F
MRKLLVTSLVSALFVAAASAAAQAEPARWSGCPINEFCVWEGPHGTGRVATFRTGSFNLAAQGLHDGARSAWNRTDVRWCWNDVPTEVFIDHQKQVLFAGRIEDSGPLTPIKAVHRFDVFRCPFGPS